MPAARHPFHPPRRGPQGFSEESIRGEMYCQLVKQLRGNGRKGSVQRGWELMALFLQTFPPPADLTPFLHAFLRDSAPGNHSRRFVDQLHRISYEGRRKKPPSAETMEWMLRSLFHGPRRHSRFSSSGQPARPRGGETEGAAQGAGAAAESGASRRYRALYDFAVTDGAMLTFRANQVLTVTDQSSADWWVAELDEDEGYVPCNFLQPLE